MCLYCPQEEDEEEAAAAAAAAAEAEAEVEAIHGEGFGALVTIREEPNEVRTRARVCARVVASSWLYLSRADPQGAAR